MEILRRSQNRSCRSIKLKIVDRSPSFKQHLPNFDRSAKFSTTIIIISIGNQRTETQTSVQFFLHSQILRKIPGMAKSDNASDPNPV